MKTALAIIQRLKALKEEARRLESNNVKLVQYKRYEDAAKGMQRERAVRDQIALLEWVLK